MFWDSDRQPLRLLATILPALAVLIYTPVHAQERRVPYPTAEQMVIGFVNQDRSMPLHLVSVCPAENPYGDPLMLALMMQEQELHLVGRLALSWRSAIRSCGDPRYDAWFRARLAEASNSSLVGRLVVGLLDRPTDANMRALKRFAFDGSRDEDVRTTTLFTMMLRQTEDQNIDLFFEGFAADDPLPGPFAYTAFFNFAHGDAGEQFVLRAIAAVEQHPRNPDSRLLLTWLSADQRVRRTPGWHARVRRLLERIAENRRGEFPAETVEIARERLSRP
jgi:hypothetical protein